MRSLPQRQPSRAPEKGRAPAPTTSAAEVELVLAYVRSKRPELVDHLGEQAGIEKKRDEAQLPITAMLRLFESAALALADPHVGFHAALGAQVRELGLFGQLIWHSPTAREALGRYLRFNALLINQAVEPELVEVEEDDEAQIRLHIRHRGDGSAEGWRHLFEFCTTLFVTTARKLLGDDRSVLRLELAFAKPDQPDLLGKKLALDVKYGCPVTQIVLRRALLERSLSAGDASVGTFLERHANDVAAKLPVSEETWSGRVRDVLMKRAADAPQAGEVAKALAVSRRSLQRRLGEEGVSFAELEDQVRSALATRYLQDAKIEIAEAAFLLGFKDLSAFYRAFRRWHGTTPAQWRERAKRWRGRRA